MKILLLADLHGEEAILDRLRATHGRYGLIVIAGDLGSPGYIENLVSISENILWIPGNNEPKGACEKTGAHCLHKKSLELEGGLHLVGFGFSAPTPFGTPGELSEEEIYAEMEGLPIDENTILVTHSPPYGIMDEVSPGVHAGSRSILRIMEEKKPRILACGHIHHLEGKVKAGDTMVLKLPAGSKMRGALIEIVGGNVNISAEIL